jgi:anti-sigma B factor antagonist
MNRLARVSEEQVGDVVLVGVAGEIDASNAAALGARLRAALTNRSVALVVDLGAVDYLDSAALNLLFELDGDLRRRRQALHLLVPPSAPVARLLAIAGVDGTIAMHPTREAALAQAAA